MSALVADIAERLSAWKAVNRDTLVPALPLTNRIRTLQASLVSEHNMLSVEQVTAVLTDLPVLGSPKEVQEVRNAFAAYEAMEGWQPYRVTDLRQAPGLLMSGLEGWSGRLRDGDVGILRETGCCTWRRRPRQVWRLVKDLLKWLRRTDAHPLIASVAFHYRFEFIHSFSDGSGRMGRLWQTLILSRWEPILAWLPVETVVRHRQQDYYAQLARADATSGCGGFIGFIVEGIRVALEEAIVGETRVQTQVGTPVEPRPRTPEQILEMLRSRPELTLEDVARALGRAPGTVERAAGRLQEQGRLRHVGPKTGGHWEVL